MFLKFRLLQEGDRTGRTEISSRRVCWPLEVPGERPLEVPESNSAMYLYLFVYINTHVTEK